MVSAHPTRRCALLLEVQYAELGKGASDSRDVAVTPKSCSFWSLWGSTWVKIRAFFCGTWFHGLARC